ncbi:MAG: hypothetical protein L0387_38175 [Acidobacteria bacterium]|nr:hypothetical protein [Acidobacteriota bacterium]
MPKFQQIIQEGRKQLAEWLVNLEEPPKLVISMSRSSKAGEPPPAFTPNCAFCHGQREKATCATADWGGVQAPTS